MDFKKHTTLGKTNLEVSRLGIGAGYGVPTKSVEKAFHDFNVNYFYWGTRKQGMGEALKGLIKSNRDKMVIALQSYDHSGFYLKKSVENGLRKLGTDYTDVLILGWYNNVPGKRILENAQKLKEQNKIRFIAMSGHNRKTFGKLAESENNPIDIFMVRYNAVHRGAENDIFPYLHNESKPGITVYTATCWGKLLKQKKMPSGEKPLSSSDCYRFVLSNSNVDLSMIGPRSEKEMDEALETLAKGPLSEKEMERIKSIGDFVYGKE